MEPNRTDPTRPGPTRNAPHRNDPNRTDQRRPDAGRNDVSRPGAARSEPANVGSKVGVPHGATETGWLPDFVYTGEKFEAGLAFFADPVGRIVRFSREPADLAAARRLEGQAALPGLVNAHSHSFHRTWRGRAEVRAGDLPARALARLSDEDVFDAARMVFLEMLSAGVTTVGEFHALHHPPDGSAWTDPNHLAREVIRAAHEVGIRIALLKVAATRGAANGSESPATFSRMRSESAETFTRELEALRVAVEKDYPADEVWTGVGVASVGALTAEGWKAVGTYARAQRLRLHVPLPLSADEAAACLAETGRAPVAWLSELGVVDKRFSAVDPVHLTEDEVKLLGTARATIVTCPTTQQSWGIGAAAIAKLLAAGAGVAVGTDGNAQVDVLKEARALEFGLRMAKGATRGLNADPATALFHTATVTGARSLGATGGALEVGRPADFFTVNLHDPSIAGADAESLLAHVVFGLERRAIRDVWIGARQRIANGRHLLHGAIVGRFVVAQKRLWKE